MKKIFSFTLVNAVVINVAWYLLFMLGVKTGAKLPDHFNTAIAPTIYNLYTIWTFLAVILLLVVIMFNSAFKRSLNFTTIFAFACTITAPALTAVYYLFAFYYGKADLGNLLVIPLACAVSYFHYKIAKSILKELMWKDQ